MQDITIHEAQAIIGGLMSMSIGNTFIHGRPASWGPLVSFSINGVPVKPTPAC
ncbi:hypothetical protein [Pseudomonas koreensis]|uniref:hypothetical protein n=1 Tax=Pseudomonas koreensis TaxID=198620 RepID=UPI001B338058|nr:hypothetical protein [Pseudomonas koreensis]MBP4001597.1 hypothetical protein [Pseudomonas koreensis]